MELESTGWDKLGGGLSPADFGVTVSLLSDVSIRPDFTTPWLSLSLTRPGALAQLSSVDGLGELRYLVILIFHMHSHKLWTPQDKSIPRL